MSYEEEYDFAYEFQQYAESLQKPLKTFRVDFSTADGTAAHTEDHYTTTFSTKQFSTTKTTTTTKTATKTSAYDVADTVSHQSPSPSPSPSQIQFNEIRGLKRESTDMSPFLTSRQLLDVAGIRDPHTGRVLTIGEAIQLRLLDVRTGEMLIGDKRISLDEAANREFIDKKLARQLLQPGASRDSANGRELSLLEVIQREINEAESGYETAEKRIKVTIEDSVESEIPKNIADAISAGSVDTKTGLYRVKSGKTISLAEAYERGYLIRHESVTIKSNALCLSDAIAHGLVDASGWIADRNSGDKFRLDSAIANQLIHPNVREIVDTKRDIKITLAEALNAGILNPKTGRYLNEVTKEKLSFLEAKNRQLIVKPYTLKDVCDLNLFDKNSNITSPMRREKLSIMQAIEAGVLDGNNLKCITKRKGELITLQEAIADGIILPAESKYRDFMTGEIITIPEAVERGLISSVSQKSIFDIDGFKDQRGNDFVSFNVAIARGILRRKSTGYVLETSRDTYIPLEIAIRDGLVRQEVYEMFNKGIGVFNASGKELTVFDLCYHNLIDPKTGYLLDPKSAETVPLDMAIERKFIKPEGALLLSSLLNITLTTETVTRTINRYVTIRGGSQEPLEGNQVLLTFTEAVRQGFIDEERQLFKDPKTGNIYSVQQALNYGLLVPDENETVPEPTNRRKTKSTITIVTKQIIPESEPIKLNTQKYVEKSIDIPVIQQETIKSHNAVTEFIDIERGKYIEQNVIERQILELPPGGWHLKDAIEQGLFTPESGVFHVQGTDRTICLEECIFKCIINNSSVSVIDTKTKKKISIRSALERDIVDAYGNYVDERNVIVPMTIALADKKILLEPTTDSNETNKRIILRLSRVNNLPDIIEVSTPINDDAPPKFVEVKTSQRELASPEPLQIAPGAIYDPSTTLVIFIENGRTENILEAVRLGLIDENLVQIIDPKTKEHLTIDEAIKRNLYNPQNGTIATMNGPVDQVTAAKLGLLHVVGAPLVAAEGALRTVRFVIDPRTGEQIPVEVAYERGIVTRDQMQKVSSSHQDFVDEKIVILQKMRKLILKPKDALRKKIIDEDTFNILDSKENFINTKGEIMTINEALDCGQIDGRQGKIFDPQRNRWLNIRQAVEEKILDPEETNHILIPLAKSLSMPKLMEQGLIDDVTQKIVHPESGHSLTLREAIVCEILDPYSKLFKPYVCTIEEAIEKSIIDADQSGFEHHGKQLNIMQALEEEIFDPNYDKEKPHVEIPPVGMTFPVAVEKSLIDPHTIEIMHPQTKKRRHIKKAIENNFIMSIPYPPQVDSIEVEQALQYGLINVIDRTFKHPKTSDIIPLREAIERGLLIVRSMSDFVITQKPVAKTEITETVTAIHKVTTKTIELIQGYVLISNNEVQNVATGDICTIEEAKDMGIIREGSTTEETLSEPNDKILVEVIKEPMDKKTSAIVEHVETIITTSEKKSQEVSIVNLTTKETTGINTVLPVETITNKPETLPRQSKLDTVKEAAKMGALGVIAAPVIAGGALVSGIKSLVKNAKTTTTKEIEKQVLPKVETTSKISEDQRPTELERTYAPESQAVDDVDFLLEDTNNFIHNATANFILNEKANQHTTIAVESKDKNHIVEPIVEEKLEIRKTIKTAPMEISDDSITHDIKTFTTITTDTITTTITNDAIKETKSLSDKPEPQPRKTLGISELQVKEIETELSIAPEPESIEKTLSAKLEPELKESKKHTDIVEFIEREKGTTVEKSLLSTNSNDIMQNVKDAAKLGAMAIIGAPILAGKAIVDSIQKNKSNESDDSTSNLITDKRTLTTVTKSTTTTTITKTISGTSDDETRDDIGPSERPQTLALGDAISQNLIKPNECRVIMDGEEQPQSVNELLQEEQLSPLDEVEVIDDKLVVLQRTAYIIDINDELTAEKLSEMGIFDIENQYFTDPTTGQKISFQTLVFEMNIFNPDTILVKNFNTGKYETLNVALERPLLDRHNGHMVDPKTGKKVPFFECIARNWIIRANPEISRPAAIEHVIDPNTGKVVLDDGHVCSIVDAINAGKLDIQSISVRDPVSGEVIPMRMAIELGVVDMQAGTIIDIQTLKEIPLEDAFKLGFLVPGSRRPISLEAAVRKGLYDPETGKFYDSESNHQVDVQKSIEIGLVDPKISLIVDTATRKEVKLDCAIEDELVVTETGQIRDHKSNKLVSFDVGVEQKLVKTDFVRWSLPEVLQREYYSPATGKVLNPATGEEVLLQQAIEYGFVELDSCLVKDDGKNAVVPGKIAAKEGLLDTVKGTINHPAMKLDEAFVKGYLISTKKPLSLVDCLLRGLYNPDTAQFHIDDKRVDLKTAISLKLINSEELVLLDPKNDSIISVTEAISKGYIDPIGGYVINPYAATKLSLNEALENRILIPPKRRRSLPDAVYRGLYDPKTGQFSNTVTREKLSTEHAIRRGILDPDSTIVSISGQVIPFEMAAETGIIDAQQGIVRDADNQPIDFREAFDRGILVEAKKPIRLMEAVVKNIYDEGDGHFIDPKSGLKLSFAEALEVNLLDEDSVQIKDFKTGLYKTLNLAHAKESGVIDEKDSRLVYNQQKVTLKHAFDIGLLMDAQAPISIQRAIHQGLFDDRTGKLTDIKTGRKITLLESMRCFIINPKLPCYFDDLNEKLYSLSDTCRNGIINRREGVFKEPGSNTLVSLSEALNLGLIVDIENAGFGLYELLAMRFYDVGKRKVIHPVTSRKLNLNEACIEDIVSLSSSLIKDYESGKYIRLANAISNKIIDDTKGCYNLGTQQLDLQEARRRGLIVSNRRLLSLEMVLRMQLFRPDTGKFCDPTTGEYLDLAEAIHSGFIDAMTTVFKNQITGKEKPLNEAIADGDIDVTKGRVFDPKTKSAYNYDVALVKGVLLTVIRPLTERTEIVKRQDSVELLGQTALSVVISKPREMSLDEAIKYNIIDPKTALVRDFETFKLIPFELARENDLVDLNKRTLVDPKALYFVFDPTLVVYAQEPLTFDQAAESKSLDLSTGLLTYKTPSMLPSSLATGDDEPIRKRDNDDSANDSLEDGTIKVCSLKDAVTLGIIDPESAMVKDIAKYKLVRLPEAFRKGLIDANKANVLNTKTSKLCSLKEAYEIGLVITPKRSFTLLESISYNLYNPTNGCFSDPFQMHPDIIKRKKFILTEAISSGLVDPSSTVVRDPTSSEIVPLTTAINIGLIDANEGRLVDRSDKKNHLDFVKAVEKGLLLAAEQRQAVFEKFNLCEENVNDLLKWITSVEHKIATVGGPREKIDELRNQINALKQIKDEIDSQQRPVATCLEQVRQIVLTGSDVLSAPEVSTLENAGRELRSRVDRSNDRTMRLLRRLEGGRDELSKVRSELDVFSNWLQSARRTLEDKERALSDLTRLSSQADSIREFVSDVIGHQADLRFITMAAQKFVDESKEFLALLNDFRTSLPERLPHVEPLSSAESPIRQEVSLVSAQYKDLMHRVNALQDRVSGLGGRQREYQEALDKANGWLRGIQPRVARVLSEPVAADAKSVQDQMNEVKTLHNELLSNGRLVDNAQQALDSLLRSLGGGQLSPLEIKQLEEPIEELKEKYQNMLDSLSEHSKTLDKTLVQSQGVQDALDSLAGWVNQAEDKFKVQLRPASLIKERLQEQIREHKSILADMQSHQSSIASVQQSAENLLSTASNARIAKKVEAHLNDVTLKFEKLYEKVNKRGEFLDDVYNRLCQYFDEIGGVEHRLTSLQEALESREVVNQLSAEETARRMIELSRQKERLNPDFERCIQNGKDLITMRDVTDTSPLRDRIKNLESQWRNINVYIDERAKLSKQTAEQQLAFESLKEQVLLWLTSMETRVNSLSSVAIDLDRIRQQIDELKPICKDYRDYAITIDKINDIGAQYDALIRPESPQHARKRSTFSPIKRVSPLRRMSGQADARSPSPTKGGVLSPLSTGSSGFGSRRSSQDGFQISELSAVQQQLSEINNRYGLIGVRLNDRQNELDTMNDEVRKQYENIKNLSIFLDRVQKQVPKESVLNKDEADRCIKQARKILEDMYEKQSLLDTTKAQIKDILRRKSDVIGADQLRVECDSIVERWKSLNDICKMRIGFSEKLRDFLETHTNLKNWLDSKERMLTVLGPISSDPRMVQSQVQQVQVLREEFRTQQPQLKHFQEIGYDVLDHLRDSPDAPNVQKKLQDISAKWEELVNRLDERANSLGGAADSSKEFDAAVNRLREALQSISDNLDALPNDGDSQENLRKIENLERQLEGQRPLLADVEQSAAALCNILGDPASRADVNSRVAALEKQYKALQKKLDTKKAETEATLRDGRQLAENCSKTLGWLSGELSNLSDRLLVSAHKPTLQHQIDTHEPIYREVMAREHEVIMLINKGKDLSDRQQDRSVKRDLERIQQQWEKLRREAVDRHTRLQTCMEHCKKYSQTSEIFLSWLRSAEDKLSDLTPGLLSKSKLETRLRDLQAFRTEVWKHSGEFENTKALGETFVSSCDCDKEPIKAELQDMRDRWERLNNELIARAQEIENCSRRLGDFNDELRNLDHAVGRCEDRLAAHDALGGAAKDPKLLDRVKGIRDELTRLNKPLSTLQAMAKDISAEARAAGGDADHLITEVDGVADRISDLQSRLDDRCGELQSAATAVAQFNEQIKGLGIDLNDLEQQVESLSPPAREIKIVQSQIDDISKVQQKIDRMADRLEDAEHSADALVDAGFSSDTTQTREQVANLRKTLGRLDNKVRDHEENLQSVLKSLIEFYDIHSHVLDDIKMVNDEFKYMKPVSSELDQIRRQQDDFRQFRQRKVEPLAQTIGKVNMAGRDLVRSAPNGVSTVLIEKDLEKLNDRWNDLKERMNERDRRLDVALLQSGKFQEALAGLSKWLSDTEEMVANQKPPSSDYKVVKAQLQEQKFLKKMLLDRQNSMSSLSTLGKEVANHCEPSERNAIEKQLNDLMKRFDALTNGAEQRELDLEEAMKVAKRFHDRISPLELWLDNTERSIKNMELIPTDEEKIQQRIREHDRLHDEIIGKKPDFSDLADVAGQLMQLVSDEEAVNLGENVRTITDRYTNLVDLSDNIGALLAESRQGLRHLVLTYQELVAWMETMENELKRFKSVPVHSEKLLEQMDHLLELNENIANHAPNVEATVESGSELMKHISNDEALQLKDKLDSLQRRYGELTNRGGDLLKNFQNALPLVQQFHEAHNRLIEWMQAAEGALATSEPRQADVLRLEAELIEMRPILDVVNLVGPQLCQISPGDGAATIESIVTRDNRRFDAIVEQIQRKAERLHLSSQRAKEVTNDIDELLEWFREMDTTLREADMPAMEPKLVRAQLQEHRSINDDVSSQKGRVRDVTAASKKVLRESAQSEDTATLREKLDDLKEIVDTVVQLCGERLSILEQALPLSEHFADSHIGLTTWLDEMEQQISRLSMPALRPDQITAQQDKNERLLQSIAEHKPLLDKLNKTGEALGALVAEEDSIKINEILDSDNSRYAALRLELRERQQALEQALQESSQFSDKLEGMLRALANTVDQVQQLDPLSALPQKIREQIDDNAALMDDIDKRADAYAAVQRAANDVIAKAGNKADPAVRDIKSKLEKLNNLWNDVQRATKKRESSLDDILNVAEPFWKQLSSVMKTLKDLEENLSSQEPPAAQPQEIQKQQVALQEIRHEIDQTKPEVEQVRRHGSKLMNMCGEPDKPEVKKHIEDLDHAWDNITALYAKREENLIDAMEKAMEFHETLQNLLKFLAKAEDKFAHLGPIGSDIDAVKRQIGQLREFKDEVDPHMVEVEALNRQAVDLTERTSPEQAASIREPLSVVNRRWEALLRGMVERQKQLEHALLHLGQFQHALNELLVWINKTDSTLDQLKPIPGDPQLLEVELAKLKVLANDIQAHQNSVDTLNDAGRQLIESEKGSLEASTTQEKLRKLNNEWKKLLQKASDRQHELEEALREAHGFIAEVQDILGWLGDVDAVIGASKPVGGLPETATEQLERFMEVYNELEENRPKVETIQAQGQEYIKRQNQMKVPSSNLQHTLRTLKQRWDAVVSRASDKKIKLEIALKEATEFHETLQAFVEWLTQAEKQLANAQPVSRVLETIQSQIEEHKVLQKDVSTHREAMLLLDKKGTHLKYFSQKQDVILIKNLLVSVQHRWERVVSKAAERTRALDHGYKEAREFNDAWNHMMQYLSETESTLDKIIDEASASKDPQKIKKYITKLKETHRQLAAKQSVYDTTMRSGKNLIERAPKSDEPILGKMLIELKEKWSRVWSKSIERQRKMEEALLLSGQFSDALGELLEWLRKAKSRLNENGPVHGDLETVQGLCEQHKHIEQDLQKRSAQMQGVLKTGRDLERSGSNPEVGRQLDELQTIWDDVKRATTKRAERLQIALKDAERLNTSVQALFDWLDHAEHKIRYAKNAPDDEKASREMMDMHTDFMKDLHQKERQRDDTFAFADEIINKAYPDAIPIIKNWMSIIQQRWDEVKQWAINRDAKLGQHLQSLKDLDDTIEELLAWLSGLEATLLNLERESLPDEIPLVEKLIEDHKEFMENTARRQNEVDRACKPKQLPPGARKMSRPGSKTPVRGSSHDIREQSPDGTMRRQSFKGSREQGLNARKSGRVTPNRDTPDRDRLPHYGPRFSPSSVAPELEFRSPRAKLLWDKWRHVWMLSWERQRRLHEHLMYLKDVERVRNFSWDDWRKRFLKYMNHKKSRLTDLFRKMDKDNNGLIPRGEFIDGILNTKFDTSRMEMGAVADLFDRNGEGLIDWQEFIAALRPDWQERKPENDSDKIHDEVKRLVMLCTCRQKFRVFQVGEGKYRFGDSQKLRLVRILRSTVMVRVGGGWVALDEFLQKNDPCRAKGRTNIELREQFILADGVSQSMAAFKSRRPTPGATQNSSSGGSSNLPPYMSGQGPIIKVRERSVRSIPMSRPTRSSQSASTPDSLSDNEGSHNATVASSGRYTPRKVTYTSTRTGLTPSGSRTGSKPNSRPASRQGSKPPSRQGSNLSLDSAGDATPSRIPQRKPSTGSIASGGGTPTAARPSRLSVTPSSAATRTNGTGAITRKTASGSASPAPTSNGGMSRSSSIPALTGFGFKNSNRQSRIPVRHPSSDKSLNSSPTSSTSCSLNQNNLGNRQSRIPVRHPSSDKSLNSSPTSSTSCSLNQNNLGRNVSGSSTPSGMQTPRKSSADPTFSSTMRRTSRGTTPVEKREPFRL